MAKELPYFKFEPNQWDNGIIQMSTQHEKGVFIDLCSMYWSRLGDVPYKLAVQKICGGNATALDSLYENKIIDIIEGNIYIKFLSEQLNEFDDVSKQNSKNAKEGWEKRRKQKEESDRNATALNSQCESDAIREDKIIEDNINTQPKVDWDALLLAFNNLTKRNFRIINDATKKQILARLKEGYTKEDLWNAIQNCYNDDFHKENNHKYLTLEFISRAKMMEKYSVDVVKDKKQKVNIEL